MIKQLIFLTIATFYGNQFVGRKTASGETYSHNNFTAATKMFKVGSTIRVTNLSSGRSVSVRINDTCKRKNIIDLSRSAFKEIGSLKDGTLKVKLEKL